MEHTNTIIKIWSQVLLPHVSNGCQADSFVFPVGYYSVKSTTVPLFRNQTFSNEFVVGIHSRVYGKKLDLSKLSFIFGGVLFRMFNIFVQQFKALKI